MLLSHWAYDRSRWNYDGLIVGLLKDNDIHKKKSYLIVFQSPIDPTMSYDVLRCIIGSVPILGGKSRKSSDSPIIIRLNYDSRRIIVG